MSGMRQWCRFAVLCCAVLTGVRAIIANPKPVTVTLFDGSQVRIRGIGDQHANLVLHEDSGNIVVPVRVDAKGQPLDTAAIEQSTVADGGDEILWDWHFASLNQKGFPESTGACCLPVDPT